MSTAKPTDDNKALGELNSDLGVEIFARIREHFRQASPNTVIDRVNKLMAEPDKPSSTVREECGDPYPPQWDGKPYVVFEPTPMLDRIEKALAAPDESETVREEWGMVCPKCGKDDEIDVLSSAYVRLTPDGSDADASHDGEHAWSPLSATKCCACGHSGIAREFGCQEEEKEDIEDLRGPPLNQR